MSNTTCHNVAVEVHTSSEFRAIAARGALAARSPRPSSLSPERDTLNLKPKWWFPKIRGTILRIPIIRIIVFWGLYWGPLI